MSDRLTEPDLGFLNVESQINVGITQANYGLINIGEMTLIKFIQNHILTKAMIGF